MMRFPNSSESSPVLGSGEIRYEYTAIKRKEGVSAHLGGIGFAVSDTEPLFDTRSEEVPNQEDVDNGSDDSIGE